MATADNISPSYEKAYYMRVQALLVDGGTLVLRNLLETKRPATQWGPFLNQTHIRKEVTKLIGKNPEQLKLLYPIAGTTDPSQYDISLMVYLLRNFCGPNLNARSLVWSGFPPTSDQSEEADIKRLLTARNDLAHKTSASLTSPEFETQWSYLVEVLTRLGSNIPGLQQHIDNLKEESIDPEKETELKEKIKLWEDLDKTLQFDMHEVKSTLKEHSNSLNALQTNALDISCRVSENEERVKHTQEESMTIQTQVNSQQEEIKVMNEMYEETKSSHKELAEGLCKVKTDVSNYQHFTDRRIEDSENSIRNTSDSVTELSKDMEVIAKESRMSPELKNIAACTKMFLEDSMPDEVYVYISLYTEAITKLKANNIVVLSGHPGEGKTTMAMKLMLKVTSIDKCLRLAEPSDWRFVDMKMFDMILIDDIFGPGVLDESLVKGWDRHLPEIWKAVQKKQLKVIIATRHYILEEAKQIFNRSSVFKKEHIQFLSSKELSADERTDILEAHMRYNNINTEDNDMLIRACVAFSYDFISDIFLLETKSILFGFPECVSMFVQNKDLFKSGAEFFASPNEFFRACLEDIRKDEKKFLAFLILWSTPDKLVLRDDLEKSYPTDFKDNIAKVTQMFDFQLKAELLKTLKMSLKHHTPGFIRYSPSSGAYRFNHNVISDMVGLVISEDYPRACLELTDREFLLKYITINESEIGKFQFYVEPYLHTELMKTFLRVGDIPSREMEFEDFLTLKRRGHRPNEISSNYASDVGIFFHDAFSDSEFVNKFVTYLVDNKQVDRISARSVMKMSGYFLSYGFQLEEMDILLPSYSLFHSKGILFTKLLNRRIIPLESDELYLALLISAHENHIAVVNALIRIGAKVSEEAIYVAAVRQHIEILQRLLESSGGKPFTRCKFEKNNNALMVTAKMGNADSVKHLTAYTDLSLRNDHNVSALDRAIIYEHEEVARILIDNGAPINEKGGKFKRTPLHTACDKGLSGIVDILLRAGARTDLKDHRGHYPIHLAAIQNHVDVVRVLALHDTSQVRLRIGSYGKRSKIKGMTVFHVAVWKDNKAMIETLLEITQDCNVQDWFGRTPFYCASFEGKEDIVKMMLHIADVQKPDKHGYTPLHAAVHKHRPRIIQLLLPNSDVNALDKFGSTPLHIACREAYCDIVHQLLERNADPHITTRKGLSAMDLVRYRELSPMDPLLNGLNALNDYSDYPKLDFDACRESIKAHTSESRKCMCYESWEY